jgi:RNA polymerase sigma-70 factor (ECF subfamily)
MGLAQAHASQGRRWSIGAQWRATWLALATPAHDDHAFERSRADSAAFERFVRQYERQILNYLWRMTGDEELAYDLTQETFLRAWQHFAKVAGYEQPRAWLFRVATNLALTQIERRKSGPGAATALDDTMGPMMSDPGRRLVESEIVRQVLLRLSPKRRAALVLREVYGLSCAEIAATLEMTLDAVKVALSRAREQFRDLYAQEDA